MRILVTGGAGFIGSHLCERLVAEGHHVLALDNLSTGHLSNMAGLLRDPRFDFIEHDVTAPFRHAVDRIYHLACPASPRHYQRDGLRTLQTNVLGAMHGLSLAKETGARFLLASTSEVYGDPLVHPQPETYWGHVNPIGPRACYDEGKRCAETFAVEMHKAHGVAIRIARIFNTYGPRMSATDGRVVSTFLTQALEREPITVYGDGRQTRSFCYVDDLVHGLVSLMEHPTASLPVNLGNPTEFTVLELAELVLKVTHSESRIVFRPLPEDDPKKRRPDISKAQSLFGFTPRIALEEGVRRMMRHLTDHHRDQERLAS